MWTIDRIIATYESVRLDPRPMWRYSVINANSMLKLIPKLLEEAAFKEAYFGLGHDELFIAPQPAGSRYVIRLWGIEGEKIRIYIVDNVDDTILETIIVHEVVAVETIEDRFMQISRLPNMGI